MASETGQGRRPTLGILAGGGALPRRLIEAARAQGREVRVVAFRGQTDPATAEAAPHLWTGLAQAGPILEWLRAEGVEELVLAGPVRRPSLMSLKPDARAARFLARVGRRAFGDDGLLGAIVRELEDSEGFRVVGVHEILDDLLAEPGPYGRNAPDAVAQADIARGIAVVRTLGALDVGQAAVVQQGVVLGVEAIEGTDALLARAATLRRDGPGGVLVKIAKPQQERRIDLPTVGTGTVAAAAAAGLAGIAVQAGAALVVDRAATVAAADAAGLFLVGIEVDDDG